MAFLTVTTCCATTAQPPIEQRHKVGLLSCEEKATIITDIVLASLAAVVAIGMILAINGVNLGPFSGLSQFSSTTAYIILGTAGGLIAIDLTLLVVKMASHINRLFALNKELAESGNATQSAANAAALQRVTGELGTLKASFQTQGQVLGRAQEAIKGHINDMREQESQKGALATQVRDLTTRLSQEQSARAAEKAQLEENLEGVSRALAAKAAAEATLQGQLEALTQAKADLETNVIPGLTARVASLESTASPDAAALGQAKQETATAQQQLATAQAQITELTTQLETARREVATIQAQKTELERQFAELTAQLAAAKQARTGAEAKIEELTTKTLPGLQKQLDTASTERDDARTANQGLIGQLDAARQELAKTQTAKGALDGQIGELTTRLDAARQAHTKAEAKIEEFTKKTLPELQGKLTAAEQELEVARLANQQLKLELETARRELATADGKKTELNSQIGNLNSELDDLGQSNRELLADKNRLQKELDAYKSSAALPPPAYSPPPPPVTLLTAASSSSPPQAVASAPQTNGTPQPPADIGDDNLFAAPGAASAAAGASLVPDLLDLSGLSAQPQPPATTTVGAPSQPAAASSAAAAKPAAALPPPQNGAAQPLTTLDADLDELLAALPQAQDWKGSNDKAYASLMAFQFKGGTVYNLESLSFDIKKQAQKDAIGTLLTIEFDQLGVLLGQIRDTADQAKSAADESAQADFLDKQLKPLIDEMKGYLSKIAEANVRNVPNIPTLVNFFKAAPATPKK